jgi:hypothetical protein
MASSEDERGPKGAKPEADSAPNHERPAQLPPPGKLPKLPPLPDLPHTNEPHIDDEGGEDDEVSNPANPSTRPSLLDELRITRTTVHEVGNVARRLSQIPGALGASQGLVRQLLLSGVLGLVLALTVALVFAGGALRLMLGILAGTCIAALFVFLTLRAVAKLGDRFAARTLPGSPWLWLGGVVGVALAGTVAVSISLWEVTKLPELGPVHRAKPKPEAAVPPPVVASRGADASMKRGLHVGLPRGVLYVPPEFHSSDGRFDLLIHFHGSTELIEESVAASRLNALVAIINVGDGSAVYTKEMQNPYAFDRLLTAIEDRAQQRLKLDRPQIARIALSAWSAGYASVYEILRSRSRIDRFDAVFLLDCPHAKYKPGSNTEVYEPSLAPFVAFARRAKAGRKLMIITHSAIPTEGYPSTTETTDALLQELSLERSQVSSASASPPPVDLPVAMRAFPSGERNWMQVVTEVRDRDFAVYGCTGDHKGDHVAHLAQMSVTVLPALRERWE